MSFDFNIWYFWKKSHETWIQVNWWKSDRFVTLVTFVILVTYRSLFVYYFFLFIRCRRDSVWSKIIYVYILWSVHGGKHLLKKTDCSSCWSSVSHLRLFNYNHSIVSLLNIKTLNFKHSMIISTQIIIIWYDNQVRKKQVAKNCVAKT